MINHARTLLLNRSGYDLSQPGEEYVPEAFTPVVLSNTIRIVRNTLFAVEPDRFFMDYRLVQYMTLLHSTELEQYVFDLDTRITYEPVKTGSKFLEQVFATEVVYVSGEDVSVSVIGDLPNPDKSGQSSWEWFVAATSGGTQLDIQKFKPSPMDPAPQTSSLSFTGGLSDPFNLSGSNLVLRIGQTTGSSWRIRKQARPQGNTADVELALRSLSEPIILDLFNVGNSLGNKEPWKTFYNAWQAHPEHAYRLGSFLLAVVYQTEAIRLGNQR